MDTELEEKKEDTPQVSVELDIPEKIDYSTDAILIDIIQRKDWAGTRNLRERYYSEILYSYDGLTIEQMPVKTRFWAKEWW